MTDTLSDIEPQLNCEKLTQRHKTGKLKDRIHLPLPSIQLKIYSGIKLITQLNNKI